MTWGLQKNKICVWDHFKHGVVWFAYCFWRQTFKGSDKMASQTSAIFITCLAHTQPTRFVNLTLILVISFYSQNTAATIFTFAPDTVYKWIGNCLRKLIFLKTKLGLAFKHTWKWVTKCAKLVR